MVNDLSKKILVTGPDGFVGNELCSVLLKKKYFVRGAQWKSSILAEGCESVVVGNINGATNWQNALDGIDTVVHLAARVHVMNDTVSDPLAAFCEVNVEGTGNLARCAAKAGVRHFVFISSIKVNGESTGKIPFSEKDEPLPEDPYGISKWQAEQLLRDIEVSTGMSVTVLRPPLLYGPGVKANFLRLIKLVDRRIPLPLGSIDNKRSLLGLSNFCDLICHCIENHASRGRTFVVSDGHDVSIADLVCKIGAALGKKPFIIPFNQGALCLLGKIFGKYNLVRRFTESLEIDSTGLHRVLGWSPLFSMDDELARTAKWYYKSN